MMREWNRLGWWEMREGGRGYHYVVIWYLVKAVGGKGCRDCKHL